MAKKAALLGAVAPQWAWQRLDALTIDDGQIVVDLAFTTRTAPRPRAPQRLIGDRAYDADGLD